MSENKISTRLDLEDDAPDLSTPEWRAKLAKAVVRRGRPKSDNAKVSTTLRLDGEVIAHFRAAGRGWQTRINEVLKRAIELERKA